MRECVIFVELAKKGIQKSAIAQPWYNPFLTTTNLLYGCYKMLCLRKVGLMTVYRFHGKLTYTSVWCDDESAHITKNGLLKKLTELMTGRI